jgi:16S rRNA processing protein RimM
VVPDDLVELGVVRGAYGTKGWTRITQSVADGAVLESTHRWWLVRDSAAAELVVEDAKRHGTSIVAKWQGCDSKEAADALKGSVVGVPRSEFPALRPGEHYLIDLVGLSVINRDGVELGTVSGLRSGSDRVEGGALQWLEVTSKDEMRTEKGAQALLIPLNDQYVDEIEPAARRIRVDWHRDW